MPSTSLEWALWLAERGFLIAPLRPGSKSAKGGAKWSEVYTTDADRIRTWFELKPNMNYLVCPGTRYAIVDVDVKENDGLAVFDGVQKENTPAPTFTVDTPSGGAHFYYETDNPAGNGHSFPPGMGDLRGGGGYVVGPGSTFEGNTYEVVDHREPTRAPDWLQEMFKPSREKDANADKPMFELDLPDNVQRAKDFLAKRDPAIEGRGGDEHTYVTFCRVRELGISQEVALELVMAPGGWNERCEPPWDGSEIVVKAENAYNFAKDQQGSKGGVMELYEPDDMVDMNDLVFPDAEEDKDPFSELEGYILEGEDIWEADTYQRYVIPEWLPDSGYACVLARRGVGKSTLMVDMASCIATDIEWHSWPVLKGYHAIYFCGEHDTVALQLLRAWRDHNAGIDVANNNRFIFIRNAGDLIDEEKTKQWAQVLRKKIGPEGKAVVFLDTWQRATSGGSQNDDVDMQKATHNAERLSTALGGPMVVAVHPPKAEGDIVMGSSIIENNSVAILTLEDENGKRLEVTRMKGRGEGNYMNLTFETIDLGEKDEHGRDVTGQAVTKTGGTSPVPGQPDDNTPDSATAQSEEEKNESDRQVFGKFLLLLNRHVRSLNPEASAKIDKKSVADEIVRLRSIAGKDLNEIELELREAGGDLLFKGTAKQRTFENLISDCFLKTRSSVSVELDGKHWDVGFEKKGTSYVLKITETI